MDGTNRRILVKDDLGLPNGLTFDPYSSMLCWVDAGKWGLRYFFLIVALESCPILKLCTAIAFGFNDLFIAIHMRLCAS